MSVYNRDIVIVGLQPWYTKIGSNCKNIALEFARHNRVLYVNSPLDRRTIIKEKDDPHVQYQLKALEGKEKTVVQVEDNLWNLYPATILESINWIPSTTVFSWLNRRNNRRFANSIAAAIREMNFKDVILFNDNDIFRGYYLKEFLKPASYVYYSRDYLLGVDYWRKHGKILEPRHIAKADVAVANSLYLAEMLQQYNPNSFYVGQGCDLRLFDPTVQRERPADLPEGNRPLIGYVGALNTLRLDITILQAIATAHPEWQLVLVGPEDDAFRESSLHQLPNVYFPGKKDMQLLPAYIQAFDVCLNPQVVNEVTAGNYPLKIDEYLAMGKPVVATATQTMELFRGHVYLATSAAGYIPLIEEALRDHTPVLAQQRIRFAGEHTWENSVAAIYKAILTSPHRHEF
ncbi:glycosyltransferase involved in cell wall biosynthesis [Chitinophaga niastensis]|uniref:Glycosyltransferase involved in cell wall biosynthesis n=1 Tax=Chitinophaga niastensis TaxID=536980 RepID=A0A2P8HBX1_CHINA|nr:glycosyltransferase [Chitinophaga niastensis]PSL43733.1 glycosyltransferase involved in cell wall biosynthesis [Chitinophaga niastensis]